MEELRNAPRFFKATSRISNLVKNDSRGLCFDAGCGTGAYLEMFKSEHTIGLDLTRDFLKAIPRSEKFTLILGDVRFLPFKNAVFNFILCSEVLEYLQDGEVKITIEELDRILAERGMLIVSVPNASKLINLMRKLLYGNAYNSCGNPKNSSRFLSLGPHLYDKKKLKQLDFEVYGCLGWVTESRIRLKILAKLFNVICWHISSLAGTLIGIKIKH